MLKYLFILGVIASCSPTGVTQSLCEDSNTGLPQEAVGTYRLTMMDQNLRYSGAFTHSEILLYLGGNGDISVASSAKKQDTNMPAEFFGRLCYFDSQRYLLELDPGSGIYNASFIRMAQGWSSFSMTEISFAPDTLKRLGIPFWFVPSRPDVLSFPRESIEVSDPSFVVDNRGIPASELLQYAKSVGYGYVFERVSTVKNSAPWRKIATIIR